MGTRAPTHQAAGLFLRAVSLGRWWRFEQAQETALDGALVMSRAVDALERDLARLRLRLQNGSPTEQAGEA